MVTITSPWTNRRTFYKSKIRPGSAPPTNRVEPVQSIPTNTFLPRTTTPSPADRLKKEWDNIWTRTGMVPFQLSSLPQQPLTVKFGDTEITPNDRLDQSQLEAAPEVNWEAEPGSLYTLLLEDQDVEAPPGTRSSSLQGCWTSTNCTYTSTVTLAHWLVTNIPGTDVGSGEIRFAYFPSNPFKLRNNGTRLDTTDKDFFHRYMFVVYKQPGRIQVSEGVEGSECSTDSLTARFINHEDIKEKYNLQGPVAGNFYRAGFNQAYFNPFACQFSKCFGFPWPLELPGINDGPDCKP